MIAITMAKDEADIIDLTVAHLIRQGARVIVADNLSSDGTGQLAALAGALVVKDSEPAYYQCHKMTALAAEHAKPGEWVIPFDADEVWSGLENLTDDHDIASVATHVHVFGNRRAIMNEPQPKVAFRWEPGCTLTMGNHGVDGCGDRMAIGALSVCHYQYRTLGQVKRKVRQGTAAYDLTPFKDSYGQHWRDLSIKTDDEFNEWWRNYLGQATVECQLSQL